MQYKQANEACQVKPPYTIMMLFVTNLQVPDISKETISKFKHWKTVKNKKNYRKLTEEKIGS